MRPPIPQPRPPMLFALLLTACDLSQLGIVTDPEPDAGVVIVRPDPGGPEPGPLERCEGVATSLGFAEADDGYSVFSGEATQLNGAWTVKLTPEAAPHTLELAYGPPESPSTATWLWKFSSRRLGEPLRAITYPDAIANPEPGQPYPGLEVTSATRTCGAARGAFRIHEFELDGTHLVRFLATFEQRCGNALPALRGCVRYFATP